MGNKLFVGGLKWEATEDDLRELFAEAGEITDAVVLHDRDTGRSRGFGFVTYANDEQAKAAAIAIAERPTHEVTEKDTKINNSDQ